MPRLQITISASGLHCDQSFVSLHEILELIDYLFVVVLTIVVLLAPLSVVLLLVVPAIKRFPGLLFFNKRLTSDALSIVAAE